MDDSLNIPRAPKLPSDLADLIGFDGDDVAAFNRFAHAINAAESLRELGNADTLPALCETVRPGR